MSGEHVVYGFLRPLLTQLGEDDRVTILHYSDQPPPADIRSFTGVSTHGIDNRYRHWMLRACWEMLRLSGLVKQCSAERVLNVSGAITPFLPTPQVSLAMNPWCYVKEARSGWVQAFKALLQRRGHRLAFRKSLHMVYISHHLRDLYRQSNRDCLGDEADSTIAWVGLDDELFQRVAELKTLQRKRHSILSVSAFAPWKGVENLITALGLLLKRGLPATLDLAGPWPDPTYRQKIERMIEHYGLGNAVTIHGKVAVAELHRLYATHQVYCLMSSSESFGIPAAESMAFGTPVVSTIHCAIAEVCEGAGQFGPLDDPNWTAATLETLLTDQVSWAELSKNARRKAALLTWRRCAQPLAKVFGIPGAAGVET